MAAVVWLLRHAESADPTVFHGAESDVDLSERGRRQARIIAPALAAKKPDAVVSSAMRRARATAEPIAQACGLTLGIEPKLHERRVADLSLQRFDAQGDIWNRTLDNWTTGQTSFAHPGAESLDDLRQRILPVWNRLITTWADKKLIVVAHGIVCKVLLTSVIAGQSTATWRHLGSMRNVGVHELTSDGEVWKLNYLNWWPAELELEMKK